MRNALCAALVVATLSGCGALKLKAGPLDTQVGVGPQMGASINVETADGQQIVGLDVRAAVSGILTLVRGLF